MPTKAFVCQLSVKVVQIKVDIVGFRAERQRSKGLLDLCVVLWNYSFRLQLKWKPLIYKQERNKRNMRKLNLIDLRYIGNSRN